MISLFQLPLSLSLSLSLVYARKHVSFGLFSVIRYLFANPFVCLTVHRRIYSSILYIFPVFLFPSVRSPVCGVHECLLPFTPLSLSVVYLRFSELSHFPSLFFVRAHAIFAGIFSQIALHRCLYMYLFKGLSRKRTHIYIQIFARCMYRRYIELCKIRDGKWSAVYAVLCDTMKEMGREGRIDVHAPLQPGKKNSRRMKM